MKKKGFTIIEVLVVLAIIGIVVAMFVPVFQRPQKTAARELNGIREGDVVQLKSGGAKMTVRFLGEESVDCYWQNVVTNGSTFVDHDWIDAKLLVVVRDSNTNLER